MGFGRRGGRTLRRICLSAGDAFPCGQATGLLSQLFHSVPARLRLRYWSFARTWRGTELVVGVAGVRPLRPEAVRRFPVRRRLFPPEFGGRAGRPRSIASEAVCVVVGRSISSWRFLVAILG